MGRYFRGGNILDGKQRYLCCDHEIPTHAWDCIPGLRESLTAEREKSARLNAALRELHLQVTNWLLKRDEESDNFFVELALVDAMNNAQAALEGAR